MGKAAAIRSCGRTTVYVALSVVWLIGTGFGLSRLWVYESTAGEGARRRGAWPANSPLSRPAGRGALLLFAHPHCPCSRATLDELEFLLDRAPGRADVRVFLFAPAGSAPGWEGGDLWDRAAALPGARPLRDEGGRIARLFGARTSGQVLLYDAEGRLEFSGGITPARGHGGANRGRDSVLALLTGAGGAAAEAPVFGCPLAGPDGDEGDD
jgi:hypothetical protein